jgi:fatty-acyl-CoA synthase
MTTAPGTLVHRWYKNAKEFPDKDAIVFWKTGEEPFRWSFSSLLKAAETYSIMLREAGIKEGEVCAIIIRHNKDFYPLYLAVELAGGIPAVLAYPNPRLHPEKFRQGIEGMSQRSGLDWILTEKSLEPVIDPLIHKKGSTIKGLLFPLEWDNLNSTYPFKKIEIKKVISEIKPEHTVLLQHSSGTTGLQKPVLLSNHAVDLHVNNIAEALKLTHNDIIISWLPLYHDMGLIAAFHLPLAFGITSVQIDTFEWISSPAIFLEAFSKEKGTIAWLPNFSYNIMADKIYDEDIEGISLESCRMLINCSEPVRIESHRKFYEKFKRFGIKKEHLAASYGMAEATFAVIQTEPGVEAPHLIVDRNSLSTKIQPAENGAGRICVSSGKVIKGCEIKICDEDGNTLPEGSIGEIILRSVSLFDGYRNYPEKTAEVLKDGWYYSGDTGFIWKEDCYVIGRKKDIIIVAGNNIYPEDVEDSVSQVEGVIPGRVVAFGEFDEQLGSEQISVIAETNYQDSALQKTLKLEIIKAGMGIDVTIKKVYLVPSRWLIKSSAGKPSRNANKERILSNEELIWSVK